MKIKKKGKRQTDRNSRGEDNIIKKKEKRTEREKWKAAKRRNNKKKTKRKWEAGGIMERVSESVVRWNGRREDRLLGKKRK